MLPAGIAVTAHNKHNIFAHEYGARFDSIILLLYINAGKPQRSLVESFLDTFFLTVGCARVPLPYTRIRI